MCRGPPLHRLNPSASGGNRAGSVPIAAEVAVINNALYSYGLQVCLHSSADVFYGARIQYTYKNAGD